MFVHQRTYRRRVVRRPVPGLRVLRRVRDIHGAVPVQFHLRRGGYQGR